jgi:hypothetical protein
MLYYWTYEELWTIIGTGKKFAGDAAWMPLFPQLSVVFFKRKTPTGIIRHEWWIIPGNL